MVLERGERISVAEGCAIRARNSDIVCADGDRLGLLQKLTRNDVYVSLCDRNGANRGVPIHIKPLVI